MQRHMLVALAALVSCGGAQKQGRSYGARKAAAESYPAAPAAPMDDTGGNSAAPAASAGAATEAEPRRTGPPAKRPQGTPLAAGPGSGGKTGGQPLKSTRRQPLLIYTANLTLAVFRASEGIDQVEALARQRGGYLVSRTNHAITVRIPAEIFHDTLEEIAGLGDELSRNVSARDVTAEFRDLEIRLQNLQAVRARVEQLLKEAKTVQAALQVERELERLTGQIEQIKGRLKLLSELVSFSTVSVTFQARPVEKVTSTVKLPFPWLSELGLSRLLQL